MVSYSSFCSSAFSFSLTPSVLTHLSPTRLSFRAPSEGKCSMTPSGAVIDLWPGATGPPAPVLHRLAVFELQYRLIVCPCTRLSFLFFYPLPHLLVCSSCSSCSFSNLNQMIRSHRNSWKAVINYKNFPLLFVSEWNKGLSCSALQRQLTYLE